MSVGSSTHLQLRVWSAPAGHAVVVLAVNRTGSMPRLIVTVDLERPTAYLADTDQSVSVENLT